MDAPELLKGMLSGAADALAEGIIAAAKLHGAPSKGTRVRVVPVYVFSLRRVSAPEGLLFGDGALTHVGADGILCSCAAVRCIVRSGALLADEAQSVVRPRDATRNIIAGLASAVSGMVPPWLRHSTAHDRTTISHACHLGSTHFRLLQPLYTFPCLWLTGPAEMPLYHSLMPQYASPGAQ